MEEITRVAERLRASSDLGETLAAGFDAFEAIRAAARACEEDTGLFAAFLLTAGAAVEGRNAVAAAPSLPPARGVTPGGTRPASTAPGTIQEMTAALATLGELLARRLAGAAASAATPGDRAACGGAARAARQIHQLLAGAGDDTHIW